ncbi:MAG: Mannonate dehydratase [Marmoricola sp.]|nr:Mannonate dehydratase [Marmoricola sp.]
MAGCSPGSRLRYPTPTDLVSSRPPDPKTLPHYLRKLTMTLKLSEMLAPRPDRLWQLVRQCGVDHAVAMLQGGEQDQRMFQSVGKAGYEPPPTDVTPWSEAAIRRDLQAFADGGFEVVAIEDTAPMDNIRLGRPGRDEEIEQITEQIQAMGRLGIGVLCYNWMALSSWGRTDIARTGRGGALVTGFRGSDADALPALVDPGKVTEDQLWDALGYFLDAVIPVAEQAGVRLAMHPDDPPRAQHRKVPRIMRSPDAYRRLMDLKPSHSNAITFCQGNWSLMGEELPPLIREFGGRDQIAFVHFRDVRGDVEDFEETFHDEGKTDLVECMRAYAEVGFAGPMRPDHVPTMAGENNEQPGYGVLGRLFALGYIRGLEQAVFDRSDIPGRPRRPVITSTSSLKEVL